MERRQEHFPASEAAGLAGLAELADAAVPGVRVACVFIPHFPLRVEILRHPELDGLPLALTDLAGAARRRIIECSPEAIERGIRTGMTLRDAVNACPQAVILTSDPVHYASVFAGMLRELGSISPGIQSGESGCAFIDLRGLARLYDGVEQIPAALLRVVPAVLRPRIGLGANAFTAWVAAHKARPGGYHLVPEAFSKTFLAKCPVDLLPVSADTRRRLERFGLYTLGDIARLAVGKMQAQFGPEGRRIWELSQGDDRSPFQPIVHEECVVERLTLPSPTVQIETVLIGLRQLTERVYARSDVRNRGARRVRVQFLLEERRSWERTLALKGTIDDPIHLETILRYRLAGLVLDGAVEELVLELSGLSPIYARQEELFDLDSTLRRRQRQRLSEAVRQLKSRYGVTPLYRVISVEPWSRIPERRWGLSGFEA